MEDINYFAQLNYRGRTDRFGIKTDDRRRHMYVIGKTGMGKTAMLQNMAVQDILNGNGVGVVDPHGEFAETLLDFVPKERMDDVVYFNPADGNSPMGLNLLEDVGYDHRHLVASGLMGVFKKIWVDVWSARMEYILNNTILALLEYPGATLLDVNRMMANKHFRKEVLSFVKDPVVRAFWREEFAQYSDRLAADATASIQNKIGQFTTAPLIRNIVGQQESTIDMRDIMDSGKIFIVNLSKGRIGEDNSRLLGAMTITKLFLAAMSRIDIPEAERKDFFLLVDEFQNFASEAFEGILSEARKYRLSLTLAHQYIAQMDEEVRDAVFGNVGTIVTFRIGAEDAEAIEKEFAPEFMVEDFVNQQKFNIMLKLMIDGVASRAFTAKTLPPFEPQGEANKEAIIEASREKYGTPREKMEKIIAEWDIASRAKKVQQPAQKQKPKPKAISLDEAAKKYPAPGGKNSGNKNKKKTPPKPVSPDARRGGNKNNNNNNQNRERIKPPELPHEKQDEPEKKKPSKGGSRAGGGHGASGGKKKNKKGKRGPDKEGLRDLLKDMGAIDK